MREEDDPWRCALPEADAERVVARFVSTFHALHQENPATYCLKVGEVKLTTRLGNRLENTRSEVGEVGFWTVEHSTNRHDEADPRRLDVTYATVVDNIANVHLVFECKRMRKTEAKGALSGADLKGYIDGGIKRFVIGSYAPCEPLGFMVGFTNLPPPQVASSIKRSIAVAGAAWLMLTKTSEGKQSIEPSRRFAPHAAFATVHQRTIEREGAVQEIVLYHLLLQF